MRLLLFFYGNNADDVLVLIIYGHMIQSLRSDYRVFMHNIKKAQ